jgi:hypothetical protein
MTTVFWLAKGPDPASVTPGFAGFATMFLLAVAVIVLVRSMVHHLRKVRYAPGPGGEPPPSERWNSPGQAVFDVREPQRPTSQPSGGASEADTP